MGFDVGKRVETEFLDNFDADSVAAGYAESVIPADSTGTGKPQTTHQLFIAWLPRGKDEEGNPYKVQPAWYSMGSKPYDFGGEEFEIAFGDGKTQKCFPFVKDGPPLNKASKMGILCDRLEDLSVPVSGAEAKIFVGISAHLVREEYVQDKPGKKLKTDAKPSLMPTKLIPALPGGTPVVGAAVPKAAVAEQPKEDNTELIEFLVDVLADGPKTSADLNAVVKDEKTQAVFPGLKISKVFKALENKDKFAFDKDSKQYSLA